MYVVTRALISRYGLLFYVLNKDIYGIHHVTAITSDPQRNIDFYANDLGLRFIKLTVNQDDPSSYHLYYGDELGRPGTILTFFIGQMLLKDIEETVRLSQHLS
jgi:catechol 2,3-dioxygenase-like lactoylglutathione lyase family enzyme